MPYALLSLLVLIATWKLTFGQRIIARGDLLLYFYPLRDYASQAIREWRLPLWNPYTFMGAPFLANSQAGFFYPLNIVLAWLPVAQQVSYSIVLHMLIATLGMYALMRRGLGVGWFAGLVGALAFGLGGYLGAQVEHLNQLQVLAWLPLEVWVVMSVGRRARGERRGAKGEGHEVSRVTNHESMGAPRPTLHALRSSLFALCSTPHALTLSALIALQILAGHTQSLYICLITLGIIGLLNILQRVNGSSRNLFRSFANLINLQNFHPLLLLILAALLATAIAGAQLVPTLELSRESYRSGGLSFGEAAAFSWRPWIIARALLPTYGDPLFPEYIAYFGAAGLGLALLGVGHEVSNVKRQMSNVTSRLAPHALRPTGYALTLVIIGFILALGVVTPMFNVLYKMLPGFNLFRAQARWLVMFALGVSMLIGLGTQALVDGLSVRQKRVWLLSWLILLALLAIGVWLGARISLDPEYRSLPARSVVWGWASAATAVTLVIIVINLKDQRWLSVLVPLGLVAELLVASQFQPYSRAADAQALTDLRPSTAHLLGMVSGVSKVSRVSEVGDHQTSAANGQWSMVNGNRILALSGLFFDPGDMPEQRLIYTNTLSADELYDRIIATKHKEILSPNLSLFYRLPSVDGYDGGLLPTRRFIEFASQFTPTPKTGALDGRLREFLKSVPENRWLAQMSVRYIIADKTADIFIDGVYYDLLFSEPLTQSLGITLTPYESTALGLVLSATQTHMGDLLGTAQIDFSDSTTQTYDLRATDQVTQPYFGLRLDWSTRKTPLRLTLYASRSTLLRALTSIDDTDHSFLSQMLRGQYDMRVVHSGDVKIYENLRAGSRVHVGRGTVGTGRDEIGAQIVEDTPERIVIRMGDPPSSVMRRQLLLRDACYPGWVARVDGVETSIRCADILFREIDLPPTAKEVSFTYEPRSVQIGLIISGIGLFIWLTLLAKLANAHVKSN